MRMKVSSRNVSSVVRQRCSSLIFRPSSLLGTRTDRLTKIVLKKTNHFVFEMEHSIIHPPSDTKNTQKVNLQISKKREQSSFIYSVASIVFSKGDHFDREEYFYEYVQNAYLVCVHSPLSVAYS